MPRDVVQSKKVLILAAGVPRREVNHAPVSNGVGR